MTFIATIPEAKATGATADLYATARAHYGYLPNMSLLFGHRPAVQDAWAALVGAVRTTMTLRRYELVTLAAARELKSSYCMLAHATVLAREGMDVETLAAIAHDPDRTDLTEPEKAMMRFAAKLVADATAVTPDDVAALKAHGFSDAEVFDIAAVAAARCFFSKMLDALGAAPDAAYRALGPDLVAALCLGRQIES